MAFLLCILLLYSVKIFVLLQVINVGTTNYKVLLWLTLILMYAHFLNKWNLFVLCSLLNNRNCSWNEYCNLPFVAICRTQFPLLTSFASSWIEKRKLHCEWACEIKKTINYQKGFIKQPVMKQSSTFLRVSSSEKSWKHW